MSVYHYRLDKCHTQTQMQYLTLCMLGKNFSRPHWRYFSRKISFDISCKLYPKETLNMKWQSLFSGKNKKNNISLSSAELLWWVVKVKEKRYKIVGNFRFIYWNGIWTSYFLFYFIFFFFFWWLFFFLCFDGSNFSFTAYNKERICNKTKLSVFKHTSLFHDLIVW